MQQLIHIVGNRPQFIKLAVLHHAIKTHTNIHQYIIHTGQHSSPEMSNIFFEELSIPRPNIQLNLQQHPVDTFTGMAATALREILEKQSKQSLVFVYGDTNTTLAGALAATRSDLRLLHFEAGVRTANNAMPEEINRILTDRLAQVNYCCTQKNHDTLRAEGYGTTIASEVVLSGDLMYDAFLQVRPAAANVVSGNNYIACTIHRAENITNKTHLKNIIDALNIIHQQTAVIMPLHPHTARRLQEYNIRPDFTIINPLGYPQMKTFLMHASSIITDSGGSSREAFFMKKPSLIIMQKPFWPEIVETKAALHTAPVKDKILQQFMALSNIQSDFSLPIFGTGNAAKQIATHITNIAK